MGLNDIGKFKDTSTFELKHPASLEVLDNNDGSPMTITILGPYSKERKKVDYEVGKDRLNSDGDFFDFMEELAIRCTVDWKITLDDDKGLEEFSEDVVRQVYKDHPWIVSQVQTALGDASSFLE